MQEAELREVVKAVFDEENARRAEAMDDVVIKAVAAILTSFGVEEDDRKELRADFIHLRRWRKSVEQAQGMTLKAVIVVIVSGLAGAVWLGLKTMLVKS
jgi:hypothetical protein